MSRVYISSFSKELALLAKGALESVGHEVVSTWHRCEFKRTSERSQEEMQGSAVDNVEMISGSDILFLLVPTNLVPGSVYVEAGVAIGLGIPVVAVGAREDGLRGNNMLYHPGVHQFLHVTEAANAVQGVDDDNWAEEDFDEDDDDDDSELLYPDEHGCFSCSRDEFSSQQVIVQPCDGTLPSGTVLGCGCPESEPCGYDPRNLPVTDECRYSEDGVQIN